jgi:preprotein translocase subunit SecG
MCWRAAASIAGSGRDTSSNGGPSSTTQSPVQPPTSGGVLDTLKKVDEQQQNRPAPSGPEAPRSQ